MKVPLNKIKSHLFLSNIGKEIKIHAFNNLLDFILTEVMELRHQSKFNFCIPLVVVCHFFCQSVPHSHIMPFVDRRQLCNLPVKETTGDSQQPGPDIEIYRLGIQLFERSL
jgi:hypothetical protein